MAQSQKYAKFISGFSESYGWWCQLAGEPCSRISWNNRKPKCKGCKIAKSVERHPYGLYLREDE